MENPSDENPSDIKKPIVWPILILDFDEPKEVIEHIELKSNLESMEELLFEIEIIHPHIANKLKLLIGHPEFELEIKKLIVCEKCENKNRQGFSQYALDHLLKIYNLHIEKYGNLAPVNNDIWELNRS